MKLKPCPIERYTDYNGLERLRISINSLEQAMKWAYLSVGAIDLQGKKWFYHKTQPTAFRSFYSPHAEWIELIEDNPKSRARIISIAPSQSQSTREK